MHLPDTFSRHAVDTLPALMDADPGRGYSRPARRVTAALSIALVGLTALAMTLQAASSPTELVPLKRSVIATYATIVDANYQDALDAARAPT